MKRTQWGSLMTLAAGGALAVMMPAQPRTEAGQVNDGILLNHKTQQTVGDDVDDASGAQTQIVKYIVHKPGKTKGFDIGVQNQSGSTHNFILDGCPNNKFVKMSYTDILDNDVT